MPAKVYSLTGNRVPTKPATTVFPDTAVPGKPLTVSQALLLQAPVVPATGRTLNNDYPAQHLQNMSPYANQDYKVGG